MTALAFVVAATVGVGMLGFSAWTVRIYTTTRLEPKADWTSWLIYRHGQAVVWLAALVTAGAVVGVVARALWQLLA